MNELENILANIKALDLNLIHEGKAYCDNLAKPPGALGKMETIYARLYAMFNGRITLSKKVVMVYVADNGVVAEGISANPQETTAIVARNMLQGKTGLCAISKYKGSVVKVIDIGCLQDFSNRSFEKIRKGTGNILVEPAVSREEAIAAILLGYGRTLELIKEGYTLFGTGEMGIGNTTTSAAVISAVLSISPQEATGYGAGLTDRMKAHKVSVVQRAISYHAPFEDILDLVAKLGGLDILGMVGTHLACALHQLPCTVDGVISITGLLVASQLCPNVLDYAFASHMSMEPGYKKVCQFLNLSPMLLMDMRLGEGSGCPLAFSLMETAVYTLEHMPTYSQGKLNREDYVDIRKN